MWAERVVARLCELRRDGWDPADYDGAWAVALAENPPRGRDVGEERPSLFDPPTESVVEFTRRCCADAWMGRSPGLRYFRADTVRELRSRETHRVAAPA
jgi:hypothetical protein